MYRFVGEPVLVFSIVCNVSSLKHFEASGVELSRQWKCERNIANPKARPRVGTIIALNNYEINKIK